jgi:y4mF family transcriptional regulator
LPTDHIEERFMRLKTPADIGALIRERRRALGLDQSALAGRVGVGREWIVDIEKGKPRAQLELVLRTLNALEIGLIVETSGPAAARDIETVDIDAIVERARRPSR